jgi:hypothetical protein
MIMRSGRHIAGFAAGHTLEYDRESLSILRHQGRLPPGTAPLVQEIGERVLIILTAA